MKVSKIGWTDYSGGNLNFISGCTPVSAGCKNCYARAIYERFGKDHSKVEVHPDKLDKLLRMRFPEYSPKRGYPHKPMAFVCDMGDLFHEDVPDAFILEAMDVMSQRNDVIWQVLTKRAGRMSALSNRWCAEVGGPFPGHIWFGVTAEDQASADKRIWPLLQTPAAKRFVSVEPCLEAVDLSPYMPWQEQVTVGWGPNVVGADIEYHEGIDWVVVGAESGPNRRLFDVAWAVDLYEQCRAAGVAFFYKQGSALAPGQDAVLPGYGVVQMWPTISDWL